MNVYCIVNQTMRLSDPTRKLKIVEPLAYSNARAHAFRVTVLADDGDGPADLTGVSCAGQFMSLKESVTVAPIPGTVTGNVCEVILPESCYLKVGRFRFTMDIFVNGDTDSEDENRTALWIDGVVERNIDGTIIDPGTPVGNITQAINNCNAAAEAASDAAADAEAAAAAANNAVSYEEQTGKTDAQKAQARANIGAASASDIPTGVVRYDAAQTLTDAQKLQARENIGASDSLDGAVRYDEAQTLTDAQKLTARGNIGAAQETGLDGRVTALHSLYNYGYSTPYDGTVHTDMHATRNGMVVILDGTIGQKSGNNAYMMKINNEITSGGSTTAIGAFENPTALVTGHKYRFMITAVSGTVTPSVSTAHWFAKVVYDGSSTLIGTRVMGVDKCYVDFIYDPEDGVDGIHLGFAASRGTGSIAFSNFVCQCTLEDLTAGADANIAPIDAPVAESAHASGSLVICGGQLYKATANIGVGDDIIYYASATTIAAQLAALESRIAALGG